MKHVCVKHSLQCYYLQKQISDFFFKCHVFVTKGFSNDIYTLPPGRFRSMYKMWSSYY